MSRRGVLVSIGLLLSIIVTVLVVVPGPAIAGVALPDIHSVGRLPDSPAYFITSCKRGITSLFTFGSHDKAILALKYANEDVLAIDTLCDKGKCEAAEEHCATFQEDFEKAAEHALKARFSDGKQEAAVLIEALKQSNMWQREMLKNALTKACEQSHTYFEEAIDSSLAALGDTVEGIYGADKKRLIISQLGGFLNNDNPELTTELPTNQDTSVEIRVMANDEGDETEEDSPTGDLIVTDVEADDDRVLPGETCRIECSVKGAGDGDLTYEWEANGGEIKGKGADIKWIAPIKADRYRIKVTVTNEEGESDSNSVKIKVLSVDPPEIDDVIVDPRDPQYFIVQPFSEKYVILQRKTCDLECVVENNGGYDYKWSTTAGTISGDDEIAVWTAPVGKVVVTVTVEVIDGVGNSTVREIIFDVRTCAPCFL